MVGQDNIDSSEDPGMTYTTVLCLEQNLPTSKNEKQDEHHAFDYTKISAAARWRC